MTDFLLSNARAHRRRAGSSKDKTYGYTEATWHAGEFGEFISACVSGPDPQED